MSNYGPNFDGDRLTRRGAQIDRSNRGWLIGLAVVLVIAVAGAFAYESHHPANDVASTNRPAMTGNQPTTGRSVAKAPPSGVNTTAPTAPVAAQ
jgi:hypothetical protein